MRGGRPWIVLLVAAGGLGCEVDIPEAVRWDDIRAAADRSQVLSVTGLVLLGVGAAGLAISTVLLATNDGGETERFEARLGVGCRAATLLRRRSNP